MLRDLAPADGNAPALEEIIGSRGWAVVEGASNPSIAARTESPLSLFKSLPVPRIGPKTAPYR